MSTTVLKATSFGLLLVAAACFSERSDPVGLVAGLDCSLPLDSLRVGNVGVIVIRNFQFQPSELRVSPGTKLTWVNCESQATQNVAHTTTADGGAWSSPLLEVGQAYTTTIATNGTYEYHCTPHPSMRGRIIVSGP